MGIAGLLSKQKLILAGIIFMLLFLGCKENMVNYDKFLEKPSAVRKEASIEVNLGYTATSANWIIPTVRFEGNDIYIYGTLTFKESPKTVTVKLPDSMKKYRIFWLDRDGKKTEIAVRDQ